MNALRRTCVHHLQYNTATAYSLPNEINHLRTRHSSTSVHYKKTSSNHPFTIIRHAHTAIYEGVFPLHIIPPILPSTTYISISPTTCPVLRLMIGAMSTFRVRYPVTRLCTRLNPGSPLGYSFTRVLRLEITRALNPRLRTFSLSPVVLSSRCMKLRNTCGRPVHAHIRNRLCENYS